MSFDPSSLNTLSKANSRRINYDLRYSNKTEKFNFSDRAMDNLDLQRHGINLMYDVEQGKAYIAVVSEDDAVLMRGKGGDSNKGSHFTSSNMRDTLDSMGIKWERMNLEKVGSVEGTDYYEIVPVEGTQDYDVEDSASDEGEEETSQQEETELA